MNSLAFQVVFTLLGLVLTLAGCASAVYLHRKFSAEQLAIGADIARKVVQATEQVAERLGIKGPEKLARALGAARLMAARFGLTFTDEQWKTLIEAAVQAMNQFSNDLFPKLDGGPPA